MDFIYYTFQLGWENSILYHCYYQSLSNQIQDPMSTQEQGKSTLFQDIYTLVITIDYHYQKHNCKHHYTRQAEKEILESYFWKQGKASTTSNVIASQNKTNTSLMLYLPNYLLSVCCSLLPRNNLIFYRLGRKQYHVQGKQ